jgi:hypothetical protein
VTLLLSQDRPLGQKFARVHLVWHRVTRQDERAGVEVKCWHTVIRFAAKGTPLKNSQHALFSSPVLIALGLLFWGLVFYQASPGPPVVLLRFLGRRVPKPVPNIGLPQITCTPDSLLPGTSAALVEGHCRTPAARPHHLRHQHHRSCCCARPAVAAAAAAAVPAVPYPDAQPRPPLAKRRLGGHPPCGPDTGSSMVRAGHPLRTPHQVQQRQRGGAGFAGTGAQAGTPLLASWSPATTCPATQGAWVFDGV